MINKFENLLGVDVYLQKRKSREYVGRLTKKNQTYIFEYKDTYIYKERAIPLGPDLPLSSKIHKSKIFFPSFEDRIPSKKNPAYPEYCKMVGISPLEKNEMVLVATLGQKGPSSFVFTPVYEKEFSREDIAQFREKLKLTIREFSDVFDFSPSTIHKIEKGRTTGKDALKRLEIYILFPEIALYEVRKNGFKVSDEKREYVEKFLLSAK